MNRKLFLKHSFSLATGIALGAHSIIDADANDETVAVLHTNDTLGHVKPLAEASGAYEGRGGMGRRAALIQKLRKRTKNTLLVDAGNVAGGTAYVDLHGVGSIYEMMSFIGYDVATVGNRDLGQGIRSFLDAAANANFPFVVSNYRISHKDLNRFIKRFVILTRGSKRIGVFGLGMDLNRCGSAKLSQYIEYRDPLLISKAMIRKLRYQQECDLVICLSRLGYRQPSPDLIGDLQLARTVDGIDMIVGGHSRRFMDKGEQIGGSEGHTTLVSQAGYGGAMLGYTEFNFKKPGGIRRIFSSNYYLEREEKAGGD